MLVGGGDEGGGLDVGGDDVGGELVGDGGGDDVGGGVPGALVEDCVAQVSSAAASCCAAGGGTSPIMYGKLSGAGAGVGVTDSLGPGGGGVLTAVVGVVSLGLGLGLAVVVMGGGSGGSHSVGDGRVDAVERDVWEGTGCPLLEFCWPDELPGFPPAAPGLWPVWPFARADCDTGWVSRGRTRVAAMATMARAPIAARVGRTQDDSRLKCGRRRLSGGSAASPGEPPLPMLVRPVAATRKETKIRRGRSWV